MNLLLRMLLVVFRAKRRGALGALDTSNLQLHVWPNDLDIQMHMNNGRFLSIMDLGRIDMLVRSGFWREARRRGWFPLVGTALITYRRPLAIFERYELTTRLIGWDERWFFIEQQFMKDGKIAAAAIIKAMIRSKTGAVPTSEALTSIGFSGQSPALPEHVIRMTAPERLVAQAG